MLAKYILGALAVVFLALAVVGMARGGRKPAAQTRTWLLIAVIFGVISDLLFFQES